MKIVFYSSTEPSFVNTFNIHEIITNYPDHDYLIVRVINRKKKQTPLAKIINYLKVKKYEFKYGKNHLKKHNKILENIFQSKVDLSILDSIENKSVARANDTESIKLITDFKPDIIIQSGAGILKPSIFNIAKIGTLNIHHGFAPEIRGVQSTLWCLYYGLTDKLGVTCHFIDENLDTGNIIKQYHYKFEQGDDFIKIQKELIIQGALLLQEALLLVQSTLNYNDTHIMSYYFSHFDFLKYNELIKNDFSTVNHSLPTPKGKPKKTLRI